LSTAGLVHVEGEEGAVAAAEAVDSASCAVAAGPIDKLEVCSNRPWCALQNLLDAYLRATQRASQPAAIRPTCRR